MIAIYDEIYRRIQELCPNLDCGLCTVWDVRIPHDYAVDWRVEAWASESQMKFDFSPSSRRPICIDLLYFLLSCLIGYQDISCHLFKHIHLHSKEDWDDWKYEVENLKMVRYFSRKYSLWSSFNRMRKAFPSKASDLHRLKDHPFLTIKILSLSKYIRSKMDQGGYCQTWLDLTSSLVQ